MDVRLFTIPGSHPDLAARLMLEHKGIPYARTDLLPVISKGVLKLAMRVVPDYPGAAPSILPQAWLEPLRAAQTAA